MTRKQYSTEEVENLLRELAAQDRQAPRMSDAFTDKMLRLIDEEVERGVTRLHYKRVALLAACLLLLPVGMVALLLPPEEEAALSVRKTPEPQPRRIALNELDAWQAELELPEAPPRAGSVSPESLSGQFRITVCVDTL